MDKFSLLIAVFLVSCSTVTFLEQSIEGRKLTWKDFSAKPAKDLDYDAYTKWSVYYKYDAPIIAGDTVNLDFRVWRVLNSAQSWVRKITKADKIKLLEHEQGHYNIAGLCVQELRKSFNKEVFFEENYHTAIDSIYKAVLAKYIKMEKQYDVETEHLYNRKGQEKWDAYFKDNLE